MEVIILILIIVFFVWLFIYVNNKKQKASVPVMPGKTITVDIETNHIICATKNDTLDLYYAIKNKQAEERNLPDAFYDHFGEKATDFSYLTPQQAENEFKQRKAQHEYLLQHDYLGYMDALARKRDAEFLQKIQFLNPEETKEWFRNNVALRIHMSQNIWRAVGEKLGAFQEEELLKMMDDITPNKIEGWVRARKHEGYFFTALCYTKARTKYLNQKIFKDAPPEHDEDKKKQIETIKRNIRRNKQKMNEKPGEELYKRLYNQYMETYELLTGEKYLFVDELN